MSNAMYIHWQIKLNVVVIIILNNHRSLQRRYFPQGQAQTPRKADYCMQVPLTHSDIITELLYAHERATVLYHALLVSDRNSSDQKNNRLAL